MTIFARAFRVSGQILSTFCYKKSCVYSCHRISIMPFYAVAKGIVPGIYTEWSECQKQINGFKGPQFKKFSTKDEAEEFIQQRSGGVVDKRTSAPKASADKPKKEKEGVLPPELAAIREDLKRQQKELAKLRQTFEDYVATHYSPDSSIGATPTQGIKRPRSPDDDAPQSDIKRRVLVRAKPEKELFEVNDEGQVVVYTDGCCTFNGRHGAKAGVGVYFGPGNPLNLAEPVRGRATNNTAEIQAITYALELIKRAGFDKAIINTDSQFVINCMTSWMSGWKKRGWKKSDGSPVINKEDLVDLEKASDGLFVKYNHVKAHCGLEGNEQADTLAKEGAKSYVD